MNTRLSVLLVAGSTLLWSAPTGMSMAAGEGKLEPAAPAASLSSIKLLASEAERASISIGVPAFKGKASMQKLDKPDRVVVDLVDVHRGQAVSSAEVASLKHPLIKRIRLAQYKATPTPITRMVFEVEPGTAANVVVQQDGVQLALVHGAGSPLQVAQAVEPPQTAAIAPFTVAKASQPLEPLASVPSVGLAFQVIPALTSTSLSPVPVTAVAQDPPVADQARRGKVLGEQQTRYVGTPITIDMQKSDLPSLLRTIAAIANMDIIHDPDLDAIKVELSFKNRPWDQILDTVCRQYGLGKTMENGILRVAKLETLKKEEEMNRALEEARNLAGELTTWTRPLNFAKANDVRALVEKVKTARGSLIVDERTNTLFITDLVRQKPLIMDFIATLDVPIQQVTIEAKIVEANIGWNQSFGVKFPTANTGPAALTVNGGDAPWGTFGGPSWNSANNRPTGGNGAAVAWSGNNGISNPMGEMWLSFLSPRISINAILQAAETEGNARVVSNPRVTTFNNKAGKILSGEKIPFPTIQAGGNTGAITISFAEANLSLEVTPQINNDNTIMMQLKVEKSEVDFSRQVNGNPTIIRREVDTNVLVPDGGTAVLGGVYVKRSSTDNTGIPFLSKLPVIGGLFRSKNNKEESRELLMFITPRVVKNN